MSGRGDIQPNSNNWRRLSYTCRCGWVDWGHALPGGSQELKQQIDRERASWPGLGTLDVELNGFPAFIVVYGQAMGGAGIRVSTVRHWVVRKGLTPAQKEQVGLSIFLAASMQFEQMQSSWPFSWVTDSGFSAEDLMSNVIGFFAAWRGHTQSHLRQLCGEVSVQESLRIWDEHLPNGLENLKSRTPAPIRFPSRECPQTGITLPRLFRSIQTVQPGNLWVKLRRRFVDGYYVNSQRPIAVSRDGVVTPR
jgi:hypothetical protein